MIYPAVVPALGPDPRPIRATAPQCRGSRAHLRVLRAPRAPTPAAPAFSHHRFPPRI
jgi:hypothetical protein